MSANRYTPDGSAIIAADGMHYLVETPHPLPLPKGIEAGYDDFGCVSVVTGGPRITWGGALFVDSTHWLARRPLPEVPRPKTQEELDEEAYQKWFEETENHGRGFGHIWHTAIAYARKCPAKQEAKS